MLVDTVFGVRATVASTGCADSGGFPWLMHVDMSASVDQVSAGLASSGRSAIKSIPFLGC